MPIRAALTDFALKNPYYAGASVAVYEVNANLQQTGTLATLYADTTGGTLRPNPMVLDSEGKFPTVLYVEKPVILQVTPVASVAQSLGVQGLVARWRGVWASGTLYYPGERVRHPTGPATYVVLAGHTSATFATDLANGLLQEEIDAASMAAAAAASLFGTVLPNAPVEGYYRINTGGTGVEARTAAQVRGDIGAFAAAGGNISGDVTMTGVGAIRVPNGLTGERPAVPGNGMLRYNANLARVEMYDNGAWRSIGRNEEDVWERIADTALTSVATIDVTWTSGAYRALDVFVIGVLPAASGAAVNLLMRARQGGSFLGGASDYVSERYGTQATNTGASEAVASAVYVTMDGTAAALDQVSARITVDPAATGQEPGFLLHSRHSGNSGRRQNLVAGSMPTTGAIDGLRFLWEGGGNFAASGRIIALGLKA